MSKTYEQTMLHWALLATIDNLIQQNSRRRSIGCVSHTQTDIELPESQVLACEVLRVCSHNVYR